MHYRQKLEKVHKQTFRIEAQMIERWARCTWRDVTVTCVDKRDCVETTNCVDTETSGRHDENGGQKKDLCVCVEVLVGKCF
jgi:hypothetical protein